MVIDAVMASFFRLQGNCKSLSYLSPSLYPEVVAEVSSSVVFPYLQGIPTKFGPFILSYYTDCIGLKVLYIHTHNHTLVAEASKQKATCNKVEEQQPPTQTSNRMRHLGAI